MTNKKLAQQRYNATLCFFMLLLCVFFLRYNLRCRRVRKTTKSDYQLRHNFACLSVRPFAWNNSASTGRIFMKFDI